MKLVSARIQMYKSIEDSEEFAIDQVTCLVGKNEAGKTAILQALQKLNPITGEDGDFLETEYSQRFLSTNRGHQDSDTTNVLTTKWELDQEDELYMEANIGFNPIKSQEIFVSKGYKNVLNWDYILDDEKIIQALLDEADISEEAQIKLQDAKTIKELEKRLIEWQNLKILQS